MSDETVTCPECAGKGGWTVSTEAGIEGVECEWCNETGTLTVEELMAAVRDREKLNAWCERDMLQRRIAELKAEIAAMKGKDREGGDE